MSHATAAQSQLQPSFWGSVWESLQGSHQDFTVGNLNRAILLLAIPMVLEMALESLFAVVDVFWVSHLGANAIATVGLTESLLTLVFAVALGLSLSTTAMVARRIGEKDKDGASVAARSIGCYWIDAVVPHGCSVLVLRTVAAAVDGRVPGNCSCRWKLCQDCAWWVRGGADAISEQRNLQRRRGCRHRHEAALGVKHHQSCARSLPDFWFGPFPASGSDRRSIGDVHGTQHRGHLSVLSPASWQRADSRAAAAHPTELHRSAAARASLTDWHPAICHRAHELDRPGPHCKHVRLGRPRRVHDCHSHRHLCDPALVGTEQCCSHACGAKPGSEAAGSRRNLGVAHRVL